MKPKPFPVPGGLAVLFFVVLSTAFISGGGSALGEAVEPASAPSPIAVAPEFSGVVVPRGEEVRMDLILENRGPVPETILVSLPEVPEGWKARIKTYDYEVTGARVAAEESRNLTLEAVPDEDLPAGEYVFPIEARTEGGAHAVSSRLRVTVQPREVEDSSRDITLSTSYPVLQGPTDAEFEFSLDVENGLDKDTTYNLSAQGPKNWEIRFKPAYEEKFISSLRIKAGQSRSMGVEVKPDPAAEPGRYPVVVKVSSDRAQASAELVVALTGTHEIRVGTADGLLSLSADQGKTATLSFFVENAGSAAQRNLRFLSFKPENWEVTFEPEAVDSLAPGDVRQVEVKVTPSEQALVGDYSVSLSVRGEKVSDNLELRVTVKASTAWGWIGIGIILLVIAGLVFLFVRVGRR